MKPMVSLLVFLFFLVVGSWGDNHQTGITNSKVERQLDLTSQFVRQNIQITIKNNGKDDASTYFLSMKQDDANHLSYLTVSDDSGSLKVSKGGEEKGNQLYQVSLRKPLPTGQSQTLKVTEVFTHSLTPFPSSISQSEKQYVIYSGNAFFSSPYSTKTQTTTVKLASSNVKSNTEVAPTSKKGDTITYGPYENREPHSYSEIKIHYENNKPFLTVTELVKEIEVSHWGNVAVEETFQLQHDGALLKGTFSRYEYQRNPMGSPAHVPTMKQHLPFNAADVYYRDEIGNVTTSHVSSRAKEVLFELSPRYPLFGGWKASWYQGYNLPLGSYLFNDASDSSSYVLNITFSTKFDDVVIDHLVTRVILPEGATNVRIHVPFDVTEPKQSLHFTYLDTSGRPVISVDKRNLISDHNQYFQVTYNFGRFSLYHEPLLLIAAFFIFFLSVMVYMRLDFKIGETRASAASEKIGDLLLQIKDIIERFDGYQENLQKSLEKYFATKNSGHYKSETHNTLKAIQNLKDELRKAVVEAEAIDADIGKRLKELERKQTQKLQDQQQLLEFGVQHVDKKLSNDSYENKKAEKEKNLAALSDDIQDIFDELGSL